MAEAQQQLHQQQKSPQNSQPKSAVKAEGNSENTLTLDSPQSDTLSQLQVMASNSPQQQHSQAVSQQINNSPRMLSQRKMLTSTFGQAGDSTQLQTIDRPSTVNIEPTKQCNDTGLENEATVMGEKALQLAGKSSPLGNAVLPVTVQRQEKEQNNYTADFDQMGVSTTVMSNQDYADWKSTAQLKGSLYGSCQAGGQTVVSQFKDNSVVGQLFLSPKMKAGLVMAEGALTFIAGAVAIGLTVSSTAMPMLGPSIATTIVGVLKFVRGALMWGENKPEGKKLIVIDALRALEAATAILGATILNPVGLVKVPMLIFGIAKAVRSLSTAITDWMGDDTPHTIIRKGLLGLSTLAHAVEVAALAVASPEMILEGGSKIMGGVSVGAVAVSKGVRTLDQGQSAKGAPLHHAGPQPPQHQAPGIPVPDVVVGTEWNEAEKNRVEESAKDKTTLTEFPRLADE